MRILGINQASSFIPPFIRYLSESFGKISAGQEINFSQISNTAIFSFILNILYGNDTEKKLGICNYEHKDGAIQQMKLYE
mmetsp:Transcript_20536/g.18173  ORF Transcript_20536/g.18173 Transcript_20536/m.18173 type:complete len:80 (+) Transcript_20536:518-757(+)